MSQKVDGYFPQVLVGPGATRHSAATQGTSVSPPTAARPQVVTLPGSSLFDVVQPPRHNTWQRNTRRQGDASLYSANLSPSRPYQFPLGTFEIQNNMGLFLTTWEVRIFTFSGVAAGETVEVDPGNLTTSLGLDFTVGSGIRPFVSESEIVPTIISAENSITQRASNSAARYTAARATNQTAASGASKGLLPFDNRRPGSDVGPFSVYIGPQSGPFEVKAFLFQRLSLPVAFFQLRLAGYLTNQIDAERTLDKILVPLPEPPPCPSLDLPPLMPSGQKSPRRFPPPSRSGRRVEPRMRPLENADVRCH